MTVRPSAATTWAGSLARGEGSIEVGSGAVPPQPLTLATRIAETATATGPEELIAAAYSSCLALAIAAALSERGTPAVSLRVEAVCTEDQVAGGFAITDLAVTITARVPGLADAAFTELVEQAEQGCPVSRALRGNVDISLTAVLDP